MVDGPRVVCDLSGLRATIRFTRPAAGNAIDLRFAEEFRAAVENCVRHEPVVVLVCADGPHFCVGGDLKAFAAAPDLAGYLTSITDQLHPAIHALAHGPFATVVAAQGAAAGAGLSILCAADIALAGKTSRFRTAYSRVGLTPDGGMSWLLPRLVGVRRATELLLSNRVLDAPAALAAGLITEIVEDEELVAASNRWCGLVSAGVPEATVGSLGLLRAHRQRDLAAHLDAEAAQLAVRARHPEAAERIAAFFAATPSDAMLAESPLS